MTKFKPSPLEMSTPTPRVTVCGTVAARPADEVRAELERACRQDRKVIGTPIPKPASGAPFGFRIVTRPPLPSAPPPRDARDDVGPKASSAQREAATASRAAAVQVASEVAIAPLLRVAAMSAEPNADIEDHYNLRWWRRWSPEWDA